MKKIFTNYLLVKRNFKLAVIAAVVTLSQTQDLNAQAGATIKFDGAGDYVNLGSALTTSLNGSNKLTIESWVNTATNSGAHGPIVGNHNTTLANGLSFLVRRENAHFVFWVGNGTIYPTVSLNTAVLNTWIHLACVWDGTVATVYVNGVPSASSNPTMTQLLSSNTNEVFIGSAPVGSEHFNGMIDEVRIWNVARTRCEINTYKNCEIPANSPGLLVNYHFNQGLASGNNTTITTLTNSTSSSATGTLVGLTLTGTTSNFVAPGGVVSGFTTTLAAPNYTNSALAVCAGGTVVLGSTGATSYTWSPVVTNNVAFTPTASVSYNYTGTNSATSCSNTAVASVTVNPLPSLTVTTSSSLICGPPFQGTVNLTASGASTYTWNTASTNTTIAVSPSVTTNYTVTGTSAAGCMNSIVRTQSVSACTGINELGGNGSEFVVYPNPTNGTLNVQGNIGSIVNVYNSLGKLCLSHEIEITNTELNLSGFPSGIYFIQIGSLTKKIIKE